MHLSLSFTIIINYDTIDLHKIKAPESLFPELFCIFRLFYIFIFEYGYYYRISSILFYSSATITIGERPASSMIFLSNSSSSCPFSTLSPSAAFSTKPFPSRLTVSIPACMSIVFPSGSSIVTACPVLATEVILPSQGAYTLPFSGIMPMHCPSSPEENAGSGISSIGTILPSAGAA